MWQLGLAFAFILHVLCMAWWLVSCSVSRLHIDPDTAVLLAITNLGIFAQHSFAGILTNQS